MIRGMQVNGNTYFVLFFREIILQITRDLAQGLRFLHSSKPSILHGDLKGRNLLIDFRFRAKLCDFGLSVKTDSRGVSGTPYWLAPEYLRGQTKYTTECDIYSAGIVIYEIYARRDPYVGEDFRETLRKICDRRINKRPEVPKECPSKMIDLMKKCWNPDPSSRPAAKDIDTALLDMSSPDAEPLQVEERRQSVRKERSTGEMLYDLFPKHVADQLKAGLKVEPENHDMVTVIFSDVVHFEEISRKLAPLKISNMLDRLYLAFDNVAKAHSVFKVETISSTYMGVTNLEKDQEDTHVKNAAEFAMELIDEAGKILVDEENPHYGYMSVRVGFHVGPVVSNVIGSLNPRYCLYGDTVNTSSRMESNSKADRILCTESTYTLLLEQAPEISAKKRGKIFVKGKGDMIVFWVGDCEIKSSHNDKNPIHAGEETKLVGFADLSTGESESEEPSGEPVLDEQLWRRDLKGKLDKLDSSEDGAHSADGKKTTRGGSHRIDTNSKPGEEPSKQRSSDKASTANRGPKNITLRRGQGIRDR